MTRRRLLGTAAALALAGAGTVTAHHSIGMFELETPVWVEGTVLSFLAINPHTFIVLDGTTADGTVQRWLIEGPSLQRMARMEIDADFIEAGDVVQICGFPPKAEFSGQQAASRTAGYPSQTLHGHVLRMPDGRMRLWGPYGKLENCVRPDDAAQTWANFVNSDEMARSVWCGRRSLAGTESQLPEAFVDDVDRLTNDPCD